MRRIIARGLMRVALTTLTTIQALIAVGALLSGDMFLTGMGSLGAVLSVAIYLQIFPLLQQVRESNNYLSVLVEEEVSKRTEHLTGEVRKYEEAAMVDALTGAFNRRGGELILSRHLARSRRVLSAISVVVLDLDHFKSVNDTYGHLMGDEVLVETVRTVKALLRDADSIIRWGGEEMVVVLPDTNLQGATVAAEKMRQAVSSLRFAHGLHISASFGVSEIRLNEDFTTALARADALLYIAKAKGRNCVMPESTISEKTLD